MKPILCKLFFTLLCLSAFAQSNNTILFIKGGSGTGGFLEGGFDHHLCSIDDYDTWGGNHGWGTLADALRAEGFILEEISEGPAENNTPVDLLAMDLTKYAVIVFGSNNTTYSSEMVDALEQYVQEGGSALFISDANFGSDWHKAPDSDQHFLDRFGWTMNQDGGTYTVDTDDFEVPTHPILTDITAFKGEGVSPITVTDNTVPGVNSTILVPVPSNQQVHRNNSTGSGMTTASNPNDAVLVVATVGAGKIAGHYDRNTFFNENGAGTDITEHDNRSYAIRLFQWLAEPSMVSSNENPAPQSAPFEFSYSREAEEIRIQTQAQDFEALIFDASGRVVRRFRNQTQIAVNELANGYYILQIAGRWSFPFVK